MLAVTACPTGIAHTYMAAENLENTGKKLGISLKAETDGSGGAQNILTKEEIREAEAIIVAADKNVEMARFDGKPVIMVPVADGIHKAEELIRRAVSGTVPVYHHEGGTSEAEAEGDKSIGRTIYKHLMNGVSHMLPFVIGGGILIALAFLLDDYSIDPSNFGKKYPSGCIFKDHRRTGLWNDAPDPCRLHCHEYRRPSGTCSRNGSWYGGENGLYLCKSCGW